MSTTPPGAPPPPGQPPPEPQRPATDTPTKPEAGTEVADDKIKDFIATGGHPGAV